MTQEERIAQLEQANAELRAQLTQLAARLQQVEGQLAKGSHTSLKPPSSDGLRRQPRSQRQRSEQQTGRTLMQVTSPDEVLRHCPLGGGSVLPSVGAG